MSGQIEICEAAAAALREDFGAVSNVTVIPEDRCSPADEVTKATGRLGVLVLVATRRHARKPGTGASTDGDLALELTVVENPKLNRKTGTPVPTVTSVADRAKDALHWRVLGGRRLVYLDMQRADEADNDFRMSVNFTAMTQTGGGLPSLTEQPTEPEETVEAHIISLLSTALPGWPVVGALAPAADGEAKRIPETCVFVTADMSSQRLDWQGPGVPCDYTVRAEVRCSNADDGSGKIFRDACRAVRDALEALLGDGCSGLDGDGFECDAFLLAPTATEAAQSDDGGMRKTYRASISGRYTPPSTEETTPTETTEEN